MSATQYSPGVLQLINSEISVGSYKLLSSLTQRMKEKKNNKLYRIL